MPWRHRSYEVLPALSVRGAELRTSLRIVTAGWGLGIIWMTCISGSWMNSFRRMLGFNDFHFGLMQAAPFISAFGTLVATVLIERTGLRKFQFVFTMGAARLVWVVIAAIFFFLPGTVVGRWLVLAALAATWTLASLGMPAWHVWMGDLIPRRIRGRYLGRRAMITRMIQFPFAISLAILIDHVIDDGLPFTAEAQPLLHATLAGMLVLAGLFGLADILLFLRIRELTPTTRDEPRRPAVDIRVARPKRRTFRAWLAYAGRYILAAGRQLLLEPLADRAFRRYVMYGATVAFAMAVGGPFFIRNMRENLGFSHLALNAVFMVVGPLISIFAVRQWGKLVDRWGRRPTLMLAQGLAVFGAVPYFFASKYTPNPQFVSDAANAVAGWIGAVVQLLAGWFGAEAAWAARPLVPPGAPVGAWLICSTVVFFGFVGWSGVMLAQQGIILGFADTAGRSKYVAAHAVLVGIGGMLGAVLGGSVARGIGTAEWYAPIRVLHYFEWNKWHATFAISIAARVTALCLLIGMPDPGSRRARDMVRTIGVETYNLIANRLWQNLRNYIRRPIRRPPRRGP